MYNLILQLALMVSLAVIVYLMASATPRVEDLNREKNGTSNIPLEKLDNAIERWKDRGLRRLKVIVMKVDNYISRQLKKDKETL